SKEAEVIARKGEKELVNIYNKGKLHVDSTAAGLRKEKLYYQIGKEYVRTVKSKKESTSLKKMLDELNKIDKEQRQLKIKIKKTSNEKSKK
ncbi:MAG: hypothetical protein KC733_08355, partial [Candidatus Omnitrophica bacterium]|nr:hypothetical protein [Candidatus Omnitrophota bacterium]